MLVVISDLHLQQTNPDVVRYRDGDEVCQVGVHRNVDPGALKRLFDMMREPACRRRSERVDLVLAGDIFELHRSPLWFLAPDNEVRPYDEVKPPLAEVAQRARRLRDRLLDILDHLEREHAAFWEALHAEVEAFKVAVDDCDGPLTRSVPVRVHYLPGNHDRLINAFPETRQKARALLGMPPSDDPFPVALDFTGTRDGLPNYGVRVRHGHEYDEHNFPEEVGDGAALDVPWERYLGPCVGDYLTVDFATRLALAFRAYWGYEMRQPTPTGRALRNLYMDLCEFDDVRPQTLFLDYIAQRLQEGQPEDARGIDPTHFLKEPLFDVIRQAARSPFFAEHGGDLHALLKRGGVANLVAPWGHKLPDAVVDAFAKLLLEAFGGAERAEPAALAVHERDLGGPFQIVVGGHTHHPEHVPIHPPGKHFLPAPFYLNSGTWRDRIDHGVGGYGRTRAYTMIFCYTVEEIERSDKKDFRRFETWTGHLAHRIDHAPVAPREAATNAARYDEPARDQPEADTPPVRLRLLRLEAERVDRELGGAELKLTFGVDATEPRTLEWRGVKDGSVYPFGGEGHFPLDPALDGEIYFHGIEEDPLLSDPLPWGLFRLPRTTPDRFKPAAPFAQGEGWFAMQDTRATRLVVRYLVEPA